MTDTASASDQMVELYNRVTDLMVHAEGGYMHGGYWAGPDVPTSVEEAGDRLTDHVSERLGLTPGERVLDVGSGNGKATLRIAARHRVKATGVSINPYQVSLSRELAEKEGDDTTEFHIGDMLALPFPDGSFDACYAIESICHALERTDVFTEIARILRPGGRVTVTDFVLRRPLSEASRAIVDTANDNFQQGPVLTREAYEDRMRSAGLEVVEFLDIGDEVRPSYAAVAAKMRAARDELGSHMDDEAFHRMVDGIDRMGSVEEVGYSVVTARKPLPRAQGDDGREGR
ncbi:SAM-dependent methyltransferase [Streptomyces sp. NPDC020379]|uniref:SAM-dependent methyltransferase n=1 Tax=Streptomyces sp. NPDC020379 TaxID=3365071 RepID=UPI0037BC7652